MSTNYRDLLEKVK